MRMSKPSTIWASGSVIASARYASSATTVEPSSSVTVEPARPSQSGPMPSPPSRWQPMQPLSSATSRPSLAGPPPSPPPDAESSSDPQAATPRATDRTSNGKVGDERPGTASERVWRSSAGSAHGHDERHHAVNASELDRRCRTRRAPRPPTGRGRRPATPRSPHRCRRPATAGPPAATVRPAPSAPTARCRPRDAMPTPRRTATTARPRARPPRPGRRRFAGRPVTTGTPGTVDPSGSATHSITLVWLATSTFGTASRRAHAASARRAAIRRDAAGGTSAC